MFNTYQVRWVTFSIRNIIDTIKNTSIKFYHISTDAIYDKDTGFSKSYIIDNQKISAKIIDNIIFLLKK